MYEVLFDRCKAVARVRGSKDTFAALADAAGVQASVISSCLSDDPDPNRYRELKATELAALAKEYGAEAVWGTLGEFAGAPSAPAAGPLRLVGESVSLSHLLAQIARDCVQAVETDGMDRAEAQGLLRMVRVALAGLRQFEQVLTRIAA